MSSYYEYEYVKQGSPWNFLKKSMENQSVQQKLKRNEKSILQTEGLKKW